MKTPSRIGLTLSAIYIVICIAFITTQGLFGESFIALLLGLPWSMIPAFFEFGNVSGVLLYILILAPIVLNAIILYGIGYLIGKLVQRA